MALGLSSSVPAGTGGTQDSRPDADRGRGRGQVALADANDAGRQLADRGRRPVRFVRTALPPMRGDGSDGLV